MTFSYPRWGRKAERANSEKNTNEARKIRPNEQASLTMKRIWTGVVLALAISLGAGGAGGTPTQGAAEHTVVGPVTGLPIPRFVSIKAAEAFARRGPSRSNRIDWVFQRRNMPMQIVAEYGHWRRVVDRDGAGGWMHYAMLSGVRTAIIEVDMLELRARPEPDAPVRAQAEMGVVAFVEECADNWCLLEVGGRSGWVRDDTIWGVEPGVDFD
jgi:SH3-like domain-containing protein